MKHKYRKQRPNTPAWLDTLITGLEFIALIGTKIAGLYALITMMF